MSSAYMDMINKTRDIFEKGYCYGKPFTFKIN